MNELGQPEQLIYVIMPFSKTLERSKDDLTYFFKNHLKEPLEAAFDNEYKVDRSEKEFRINDQIIKNLFNADIVICDLSGEYPNPNVMYELGVRLAFSKKPVILIREEHVKNKEAPFDIRNFGIFYYTLDRVRELEKHLIEQIKKFGIDRRAYRSPIHDILETDPKVELHVLYRAGGVRNNLQVGAEGLWLAAQGAAREIIDPFIPDIFLPGNDTHTPVKLLEESTE